MKRVAHILCCLATASVVSALGSHKNIKSSLYPTGEKGRLQEQEIKENYVGAAQERFYNVKIDH